MQRQVTLEAVQDYQHFLLNISNNNLLLKELLTEKIKVSVDREALKDVESLQTSIVAADELIRILNNDTSEIKCAIELSLIDPPGTYNHSIENRMKELQKTISLLKQHLSILYSDFGKLKL
jgi:hypothetical protein